LDIGVLGYIGIVWPKEHSPEVWSVPPVTSCIWKKEVTLRKTTELITWDHNRSNVLYLAGWMFKNKPQWVTWPIPGGMDI